MARPLKTAGLAELTAVRKRVKRQLAMERIDRADHDYIVQRLDEIEARVVGMREEGGDGD
ncbi:MAG: hypothetical protein IPK85_03095 [Gemmatimonadetes bacterium]|nr:hypothetical protein [Gemmatimonadota bacterium]